MMREIKFRAWHKESQKMLPEYGVLAKIEWGENYVPNKIGVYEYRQINEQGDGDWDGFELDDFELMQYTGLKDKNGKEIYENDIVHIIEYLEGEVWNSENHFGIIVFNNGKFDFTNAYNHQSLQKTTVEIVGNIFENPELIKEIK